MTDFDYDVFQKKRIARGSFARKNGCRSKRCTLLSDYLSPSELKRRNGPMKEYKMNAPMKWAEFVDMPADLQAQYITGLREKYTATDAMLGEMFGVHFSTVYTFRKAANLCMDVKMPRLGDAANRERYARWAEFAGLQHETVAPEDISPESVPVADLADEPKQEMCVGNVSATFTGEFDPTRFWALLTKLPIPTGNVQIRIEVSRV